MKLLTSRENPVYKELKQLATSSQARRKAQRTLLDGVHLAQSYLDHAGMPAMCVVSQSGTSHVEVRTILDRCLAHKIPCIGLPDALYASVSQVEQGVGIFLVIETPRNPLASVLTRAAVLIDQLQDPGNLGSILRSAAAAGIEEVYCSPGTVFAWSPKVLRAAMGAHFALRIHEHVDLATLIAQAQLPVLATSSHADRMLFEADLSAPVAWLFGNEGQGVAPGLLAVATATVAIPHAGPVESLNVAAAAAICFFEQLRQRRSC